MSKIIFYNYCRNGDIHISRNFISAMSKLISSNNFFYFHKNDSCLLADLPNISHLKLNDGKEIRKKVPHTSLFVKYNDDNYINTWFSADNSKYIKKHGITFDCLYFLFKDIFLKFNLKIENVFANPLDILPQINYNFFEISKIDQFYDQFKNKKNILICNGLAMSNQASNFDFTNIILKLSSQYPNFNFIVTNDLSKKNKNIFFTSEIINKKSGSDLNEISYLSLKCDTIIGRASGPFSFSMVRENFDNPNKKMITFSNLSKSGVGDFYLGDWGKKNIKYKAKIIQSNETNLENVFNIIKNNM
jgi:hypothetical protein